MVNRKAVLMPAASAFVGYVFQKALLDSACKTCPMYSFCGGDLNPKSNYRVTALRDTTKKCPQTGEDLRAVDIVEEPLTVLVEKRGLLKGITVRYKPVDCEDRFNRYYFYCRGTALQEGDRIRVEEIVDDNISINGKTYALVKAILKA